MLFYIFLSRDMFRDCRRFWKLDFKSESFPELAPSISEDFSSRETHFSSCKPKNFRPVGSVSLLLLTFYLLNKIWITHVFPSLGYYSNEQVQGYILLPLIDLLMSTPASLAISKVSELELLTVLARHDHHKEGMWSSLQTVRYIHKVKLCFPQGKAWDRNHIS